MTVSTGNRTSADAMKTYGKAILEEIERRRWPISELARRVAPIIGRTQLHNILHDKSAPSEQSFTAIADALMWDEPKRKRWMVWIAQQRNDAFVQVYIDHLLGRIRESSPHYNGEALPTGGPHVPIFEIAAGDELAYDDGGNPVGVADDYLAVPGLTDPNAFGCFVRGDSMEPDLHEGDIAVFSPALPPASGDICCIRTEDEMTTIKQVFFEGDEIRLVPANHTYPEERLPKSSIACVFPMYGVFRISIRQGGTPQ